MKYAHQMEEDHRWSATKFGITMMTITQTLTGLVALCKSCHRSKHMALARHKGWEAIAEEHLMRINGWERATLNLYLEEAFRVFEHRSEQSWTLDITWLESFDVVIPDTLDRI